MTFLLTRGQQIKVMSMLLRKCRKVGLLVPNLPKNASDDKYEGATVIEPIKAYYQKPIATLVIFSRIENVVFRPFSLAGFHF